MAATTKLIVYNDALRELGAAPLVDTTTANKALLTLDTAYNQAVEYVLSKQDWNFARRRSTLSGVADTAFPPYTLRYAKPSDYLRKVWLRRAADDEFQAEHAEIAAVFYGHAVSPVLEYISDTADNYDPVNWPPHFTRIMVVYLALLAGPSIARTGEEEIKGLYRKLEMAEGAAVDAEAVFTAGTAIASNRLPVMRRAIEIMGQTLGIATQSQADKLRWHMNKAWTHSVRYCLEQGAWNFATSRAVFDNAATGDENVPSTSPSGIIEGYSVEPAAASTETPPDISGFAYSYALPADFRHKIWIKADVANVNECRHQRMGAFMFTDVEPAIMEYVAENDDTTDPDSWPATFMELVASHLALTVSSEYVIESGGKGARIKGDGMRSKLEEAYMRRLSDAKNKDAIQQEPLVRPVGSYVRARLGGYSYGRRLN